MYLLIYTEPKWPPCVRTDAGWRYSNTKDGTPLTFDTFALAEREKIRAECINDKAIGTFQIVNQDEYNTLLTLASL